MSWIAHFIVGVLLSFYYECMIPIISPYKAYRIRRKKIVKDFVVHRRIFFRFSLFSTCGSKEEAKELAKRMNKAHRKEILCQIKNKLSN